MQSVLVGFLHKSDTSSLLLGLYHASVNRISIVLMQITPQNRLHYGIVPVENDVKLRLLAHSRSFLANQKARNAIVGAENLLILNISFLSKDIHDQVFKICKLAK